jgi:leucyl-tRNA synthetase
LNNLSQEKLSWPTVSSEELIEEEINFVVQINGKKRALLRVKRDMEENKILEEIKLNTETKKLLEGLRIQKTIFVSNRLINIIL